MLRQSISSIFTFFALEGSSFDELLCSGEVKSPWVVYNDTNLLRLCLRTYQVENIDLAEDDPFAGLVSAMSFAVRSKYHTTFQSTPGQLVFGRDMIFPIYHIADWQIIKNS
jgi:hypothetical protein